MASARRIVLGRTATALIAALLVGVCALVAPPLALLALATLAAYVALQSSLRFNLAAFAGPIFAALIGGALAGPAVAIGILFAWRVWTDARWSIGEAKRLAIAAGRPGENRFAVLAHAWVTPVFGLCLVAYTSPHILVGLPLDLPHVPIWVPITAGATAALLVFDWAVRRAADWRLGELAPGPAAHLLAHHLVFALAYGLTLDISAGLFAICAWRLAHAAPFKALQPNLAATRS